MALALIKKASKVDGGLPKRLYSMMFTNIMIDFAIGFIPLLGDIVDMFYRANTRNAWLLDAYLTEKAQALRDRAITDPDTGAKVPVPSELQVAPEDRDLEEGIRPVAVAEPTAIPPAVAPARTVTPARTTRAPVGTMAPHSRTPTPGRNLTGQRTPGPGLPGRQVKDPRDRKG
jgi:hypothetical protein